MDDHRVSATKTAVPVLSLALIVVVSGSLAVPGSAPDAPGWNGSATPSASSDQTPTTDVPDPTTGSPETEPSSPTEAGDCGRSLPDLPANVTAVSAKAFADEYEETLTYNDICDADEFGLSPTVAGEKTVVEAARDEQVFVFVQQPFSYREDNAHADGADSGVYFVEKGSFVRVPYRGVGDKEIDLVTANASRADPLERTIRVINFDDRDHSLNVSLRQADRRWANSTGTTTVTLPPSDGIRLEESDLPLGNYTLTVSGPSVTRKRITFEVRERPRAVAVYVDPEGDLWVFRLSALR